MHRLRKCVKNQFTASRNPCPGYDFRCAVQGSSQRKRAVFGGFRHKFYGTFCRSRSGEHIRVCPIPGNVLRKTRDEPGRQQRRRRHDKPRPSIRPPGGLPRPATHTHGRAGNSNEPLGAPLVLMFFSKCEVFFEEVLYLPMVVCVSLFANFLAALDGLRTIASFCSVLSSSFLLRQKRAPDGAVFLDNSSSSINIGECAGAPELSFKGAPQRP